MTINHNKINKMILQHAHDNEGLLKKVKGLGKNNKLINKVRDKILKSAQKGDIPSGEYFIYQLLMFHMQILKRRKNQ